MNNSLYTCDRYIAFFDIIGFKNQILEKNHEDIIKKLYDFYSDVTNIKKYSLYGSYGRDKFLIKVKYAIFSDTILIISDDSSNFSNLGISFASIHVLTMALVHSVPIKGAIAFGKMTADFPNSIFVGKPKLQKA